MDLADGKRAVLEAELQKVGAADVAVGGRKDGGEDGNAGTRRAGRAEAEACESIDKARWCFERRRVPADPIGTVGVARAVPQRRAVGREPWWLWEENYVDDREHFTERDNLPEEGATETDWRCVVLALTSPFLQARRGRPNLPTTALEGEGGVKGADAADSVSDWKLSRWTFGGQPSG